MAADQPKSPDIAPSLTHASLPWGKMSGAVASKVSHEPASAMMTCPLQPNAASLQRLVILNFFASLGFNAGH